MTKPINLVPYLDRLSDKQRAIIMRCVNLKKENDGENAWVHLGILPFVTKDEAIGALHRMMEPIFAHPYSSRLFREILSVLEDPAADQSSTRFMMRLSDKKVHRVFGKNPERGKVLPWLPKQKVTVGFTNRFGKMKPDDQVHVAPCVRLVKNAPNHYTVEVLAKCRKQVEEWLHANCA